MPGVPRAPRVPLLRHLAPRSGLRDEEGALPVFEAIIAGMLVLTAILFLTAIGRPAPASGQSGIDLGQNAADTLGILRDRDADDPVTYPDRLSEIVDLAVRGDTSDAEGFLDEIVPLGTRYLLRLDNGVEPLVLLPHGSGPALTPRAAQAASVLVIPDWTANGALSAVTSSAIQPGQEIPAGHPARLVSTTHSYLVAPTGSTTMPDGTSWQAHWSQAEYTSPQRVVPPDVPYGVWKACQSSACNAGEVELFKVVGPSGTEAEYPVYGVQLVVWLAA